MITFNFVLNQIKVILKIGLSIAILCRVEFEESYVWNQDRLLFYVLFYLFYVLFYYLIIIILNYLWFWLYLFFINLFLNHIALIFLNLMLFSINYLLLIWIKYIRIWYNLLIGFKTSRKYAWSGIHVTEAFIFFKNFRLLVFWCDSMRIIAFFVYNRQLLESILISLSKLPQPFNFIF